MTAHRDDPVGSVRIGNEDGYTGMQREVSGLEPTQCGIDDDVTHVELNRYGRDVRLTVKSESGHKGQNLLCGNITSGWRK